MKKKYEAPTAEAVKFEYKDQVVAASGKCEATFTKSYKGCEEQTPLVYNER